MTHITSQDLQWLQFKCKKKNKTNAKKEVIDGVKFASKAEAKRYKELKLCENAGAITDLKLQPKFKMPVGFTYIGDFQYIQEGKQIIEDVKGFMFYHTKLKIKCFRYFYPDLELRIVK